MNLVTTYYEFMPLLSNLPCLNVSTGKLILIKTFSVLLPCCSCSYHNPHMLILMHLFELSDILLLMTNLRFVDSSFPLMDYIRFILSSTRSPSLLKLVHVHSKSSLCHHCYSSRVVRLWKALVPIDLDSSYCPIKHAAT